MPLHTYSLVSATIILLLSRALALASDAPPKWRYENPASGKSLYCDWCRPGEWMYRPCTEHTPTECLPCPIEENTEIYNHLSECVPCRQCNPNAYEREVLPCTRVQNRQCECVYGYHLLFESCSPHTNCPKGQGVEEKGTHLKNTRCMPCWSGTFSDRISPTHKCRAHTDCAAMGLCVVRRGNSKRDNLCGACVGQKTFLPRTDGYSELPVGRKVEARRERGLNAAEDSNSEDNSKLHYLGTGALKFLLGFISAAIMIVFVLIVIRRHNNTVCVIPEKKSPLVFHQLQALINTGQSGRSNSTNVQNGPRYTVAFINEEGMSELTSLRRKLAFREGQVEDGTIVHRRLKTELIHSKELCRKLEEENFHLKSQEEADKSEIERLKGHFASLFTDNSSSYDMSHDPSGVCVIINNIHFEDMAERDGAEGDTDRIQEAFESLGFTVLAYHDLDNTGMWKVMKNQGKADHSNYDCFVCVIMSHGTMGKVYSSDDVGIDICELMKPVNAKKCPSLKGKPKLFFIQACQGEKTQRKESFDHGEYDAKPVPFICNEADFFLGLATVPGYVARRDQDGAPYVHHLAKLLKDFGPTHDLSAIMAMVCDKMNDINDDKFGWISSNHSTLRKKVVFNTK